MSVPCRSISPVRIAVIQFDPQVGVEQGSANLERSLMLARQAISAGANLIVLPELSNTGTPSTAVPKRTNTLRRLPKAAVSRHGNLLPGSMASTSPRGSPSAMA